MAKRRIDIDEKKNEIIALYEGGLTMRDIGKKFGTTCTLLVFRFKEWNIKARDKNKCQIKPRIKLICCYCGNNFDALPSRSSIRRGNDMHFCSFGCWDEFRKENKTSVRNRKSKFEGNPNITCDYCERPYRIGKRQLNNLHHFCSIDCRNEYQRFNPNYNRFDENCHGSGENSSHWKDGITSEYMKVRNSDEYKEWRFKVFVRDSFTCQLCHSNRENSINKINLNAHHIKSFKEYTNERLNVDNGITVCEYCHQWIHNLKPLNQQ